MKNTIPKPAVVPTFTSQKGLLWALLLIALFGALLWLYSSWSAFDKARARRAEPVKTVVSTPLYDVKLPLGWEEYSRDDFAVAAWRREGNNLPILHFLAERDLGNHYHAIDLNSAVILRIIGEDITAEHIPELPKPLALVSKGVTEFVAWPHVRGVRIVFDFDMAPFTGEAVIFYSGDIRYIIWSVWPEDDTAAGAEVQEYLSHLFNGMSIPDLREAIDRPVVNSADLTAEINERVHLQVDRELALWRLFAARAETEPNAALLPALVHYREALRLLSSIRQERLALASEDFILYRRLLDKRRQDVEEWFVVLDKAMAMRDWKAARAQADWIMTHATLTGERVDARRAADTLAKIPEEEK